MKFCFGDLEEVTGATCRNGERRNATPAQALAVPVRIVDGGVRLPASGPDTNR